VIPGLFFGEASGFRDTKAASGLGSEPAKAGEESEHFRLPFVSEQATLGLANNPEIQLAEPKIYSFKSIYLVKYQYKTSFATGRAATCSSGTFSIITVKTISGSS